MSENICDVSYYNRLDANFTKILFKSGLRESASLNTMNIEFFFIRYIAIFI